MIRKGIFTIGQLKSTSFKDTFGKEKNISIFLYKQINEIKNASEKIKYAELVLNRFNSDRNVLKRTYKNRFNNFDNLSVNKISEQNYDEISIFDIAISDGCASYYFLERVVNQFQNFCYTGSDIHINYYLNKKYESSRSYIITDENKKVVEITKPPFVWNFARTEGRFYFINNFLKKHYLKKAERELKKNKIKFKEKIELIHPDFKTLLSKNSEFKVQNYNLFNEIPGKYTIIRAMNILHLGYFNDDQLILILNNLYNGLETSGLLIEGSNENAGTPVEGAIYKKCNDGFMLLSEPEKPSRIKKLILSFRPGNLK
jgi:hypothetical protein